MATAFDVLAEPARRRILDLLRDEPRLVGDLVERLGLSQPGTSKHLRVLREAGLGGCGRRRSGAGTSCAPKPPLAEVDAWLEPYRRLWAGRLDALERHLDEKAKERDMTMPDGVVEKRPDGKTVVRFERRLRHPVPSGSGPPSPSPPS